VLFATRGSWSICEE
jgi:hypothetical protein